MTNLVGYRAGEVIIAEGASTSEAYILDRGTAEVYLKGPPEQRLRVLQPGDIFGEMALLTERPRSASAARDSLGGRRLRLDRFPFRIGRATKPPDPLSPNDLTIADREPYRVSRTHCLIVPVGDRWFLIDRGSRLGAIVNGTVIGGGKHTGRIQLWDGRNELELGGASTPYRFWLTIGPRG